MDDIPLCAASSSHPASAQQSSLLKCNVSALNSVQAVIFPGDENRYVIDLGPDSMLGVGVRIVVSIGAGAPGRLCTSKYRCQFIASGTHAACGRDRDPRPPITLQKQRVQGMYCRCRQLLVAEVGFCSSCNSCNCPRRLHRLLQLKTAE